eukprot:5257307-Pyramimonas_sp.AAC.2
MDVDAGGQIGGGSSMGQPPGEGAAVEGGGAPPRRPETDPSKRRSLRCPASEAFLARIGAADALAGWLWSLPPSSPSAAVSGASGACV